MVAIQFIRSYAYSISFGKYKEFKISINIQMIYLLLQVYIRLSKVIQYQEEILGGKMKTNVNTLNGHG